MATVNFNTHLPGYTVLAELGRGNTRVLKARHVASGDLVAIKQFAFPADADTLRRFDRESQIMTRINHPNVVRVREVHLDAAMPYVVMDYVEGGDLRGLLRQEGHLPIVTTIRLGLQLTHALRAVHPMQVVHRDIKPENILYRPLSSGELHFLLTDFGIAKFWSDDSTRTRTGQSLMTYEYAAPEQFDNPRQVDEAADYYALGVVLYECLTGHVPFVLHDETGLAKFMQQVLTAPMPPLTRPSAEPLPPSLTALLTGLLARNPNERLRDTNQMELLLEQSRVELLKADWLTQMAPVSKVRTMAGPVATPAADLANEPEDGQPANVGRVVDRGWIGWVVAGIVLAVLAFGLYTRQASQSSSGKSSAPTEAEFRTAAPDSTQADTATDGLSAGTESSDEEVIQSPPDTEPVYQQTTDSTDNRTTTVVADSAAVTPPDSAQ